MFRCVFCKFPYTSKAGLKRHMSSCPDNDDLEQHFDDIEVAEGVTVTDIIRWQEELFQFMKHLAASKELAQFQTETPDEIRSQIYRALCQLQWTKRFPENIFRGYEVYMIYEFFFALTEDDIQKRLEEFIARMEVFYE